MTAAACPAVAIKEPQAVNYDTLPSNFLSLAMPRPPRSFTSILGKDTDTELRSWGDAHESLWRALRSKGIEVRAIVVGADYKATIRAEAALQTWSQRALDKSSSPKERPSRNDPEVTAEIQHIENALRTVDRATIARYDGVRGITKRLRELKDLPKSSSTIGITIDGFETWVSDRLRMQESDL